MTGGTVIFSVGFGGDCLEPDWTRAERVHDWRNYISDDLRSLWDTFTVAQKLAIARNAEEAAGREHWD